MKVPPSLFTLVFTLLVSQAAYGDNICIQIDENRDNLQPGDRQATLMLVEQELEDTGHTVLDDGCVDTIVLSNVKLGSSITVTLTRGDKQRRLKASGLDDLPSVYSQLVKSLLSDKSLEIGMDRTNVTKDQADPKRAKADFLTIFKGGSLIHTAGAPVGPAFGAGIRVELDEWAIEAESTMGFSIDNNPNNEDTGGSYNIGAHLGGIYFLDGQANHSPFFSGGIGYGATSLVDANGDSWAGAGFDFRVAAGYEMLRASTIRMFFQAEALIPAYLMHASSGNDATKSQYNPTFLLSFGVGYEPDLVVGGFLF